MSVSRRTSAFSESDAASVTSTTIQRRLDPFTKRSLCQRSISGPLSILVISTQEYCDKLSHVMSKISEEKFDGKIKLRYAESAKQVLDSGMFTSVDYVAIVCNTGHHFTSKLMSDIRDIGTMGIVRLVLVNGTAKEGLEEAALEFVKIAEANNLMYINGQITENVSCKRVAERILHVATSCCGLNSGIPFVFPTPKEVYFMVNNKV